MQGIAEARGLVYHAGMALSRHGKIIVKVARKKSVARACARRIDPKCRPQVMNLGIDDTGHRKYAVLVQPDCATRAGRPRAGRRRK